MTAIPRPVPGPQAQPVAVAQPGASQPAAAAPSLSRPAVIALPAEIDVTNHRQIQDILIRALDDGAMLLVADASGTTFCDCAGARTLLEIHHRAVAAGAQLRLVAAGPELRLILAMTRADYLLDSYPTLAAALDGTRTGSD
ncbi:MAG TPA: STAS domain-containing protein [Streptosporangiaceae bacterium]